MTLNGIQRPPARFSQVSDDELNKMVDKIHSDFPNSSYREVKSLLETRTHAFKVQITRVREALRAVDPNGSLERR